MNKLEKLMKKKSGHDMSEPEKHAKMSQLEQLRDMAGSAMSDKLKNMKGAGVSVLSDSKEGLKQGLNKAKQILGAGHDGYNEDPSASHHKLFGEGSAEHEAAEPLDEMQSEENSDDVLEGQVDAHMGAARSDGTDSMSHDELDKRIAHLQSLKQKLHNK